ncbi:MAG TPA: glycosyltransferase family 92 protein [Chlamydiales bacterium]|nr:glycosyltransferase family 92 protein [Chlamydiales bacterium]
MSTIVSNEYRYDLSIVAIFRDEAPYLKEWIEFHKLVGVQHFYLYNHLSTDDYHSVLKEYIEQGIVELLDWSYPASSWENWLYDVQAKAYEHCILCAQNETKWLAIIDIDEFLTPIQSDCVLDVLKDYEDFGGVGFNWKIFGHSGFYDLEPNQLLIEALTMTAVVERPTHLGIKSIVRPERVAGCTHPHYVVYKDGFYHVNSNKDPSIDSQGTTNGVYYDRLVINHYYSRTGRYFYKKLLRWKEFVPHIMPEHWLDYVKDMNVLKDHSMDRFIEPLRAALNNP